MTRQWSLMDLLIDLIELIMAGRLSQDLTQDRIIPTQDAGHDFIYAIKF